MKRNLIGFGSFGAGDVVPPLTTSSFLAQTPQLFRYVAGAPPRTVVTLPGSTLTVPSGTPDATTRSPIGPNGGPLMQELPITAPAPNGAPLVVAEPDVLYEQENVFISEPEDKKMSTAAMVLLAAAALGAGYWFFIAKKPKGERA